MTHPAPATISTGIVPPEAGWVTERRRGQGRRTTDSTTPTPRPAAAPTASGRHFGERLRALRVDQGLSLRALAGRISRDPTTSRYDPTTLGRYERGSLPPTSNCAEDCDRVLDTGGELLEIWQECSRSLITETHIRTPQLGGGVSGLRLVDLPAGPPTLAGHADALTALDQILHDLTAATSKNAVTGAWVVVVGGAPGAGKTALALHWAWRVQQQFPGGAGYIDLRPPTRADGTAGPLAPHDALEQLLAYVVATSPPSATRDRVTLWRTAAADHLPMLIVLDDAAAVEQIAPLITGAAGSLILVTSQHRLCSLAPRPRARITLAPLPDNAARHLVREIAGPIAATHPDLVTRIIATCAGSPRALETAADRLSQDPDQPLDAILQGITAPPARPGR